MSASLHASRRVLAIACPLCGGAKWKSFVDGGPAGFEWMRCDCGAVFKRSEPESGEGEGEVTCSPGDARSDASGLGDAGPGGHYDGAYFDRYARRRRRRIAKSRRQILDALEVSPRGRLLDVGCSLGYALEAARSLGLDASGVDLSVHAIECCRRLGFDARAGTLEHLPFDDASFSVVILKHVFEHTGEPRAALAELRRVLVPGAAAFFAVPHLGYLRAALSPSTSRFFRGEAGRAHHVYYSPATLSGILEDEGFRVVGVHPRLVHRRAGTRRFVTDAVLLPLTAPLRAARSAARLRKEFWLVAVRK